MRDLVILSDVEYSIDSPSKLEDVSVIDFGGRFRRQADGPNVVSDHTEEATTPNDPNVIDDTKFGPQMFPEEYNVKHVIYSLFW